MSDGLSHSSAHYLMAIRDLLQERGYARGVDVAQRVGVSRTAAYTALKSLKKRGFVREDERHFFSLPDDAELLATRLRDNQEALTGFFHDVLGLASEEAERNACDIEHHLSENASDRLLAFLQFVQSDAKGHDLITRFCRNLATVPPCRQGGNARPVGD